MTQLDLTTPAATLVGVGREAVRRAVLSMDPTRVVFKLKLLPETADAVGVRRILPEHTRDRAVERAAQQAEMMQRRMEVVRKGLPDSGVQLVNVELNRKGERIEYDGGGDMSVAAIVNRLDELGFGLVEAHWTLERQTQTVRQPDGRATGEREVERVLVWLCWERGKKGLVDEGELVRTDEMDDFLMGLLESTWGHVFVWGNATVVEGSSDMLFRLDTVNCNALHRGREPRTRLILSDDDRYYVIVDTELRRKEPGPRQRPKDRR